MTEHFKRVANCGEPSFVAPCQGPLWRHICGRIVEADLLGETEVERAPQTLGCDKCGHPSPFRPLFAYTGALCDQCDGNGWVPIGGKVHGAPMGYRTVTECTACNESGMAL